MRLVLPLFALSCAVLGILFGALNPSPARVDLYWFEVESALGVTVLAALLIGALLGGLAVIFGVVWPLRRRLKRARREQAQPRLPATSDEARDLVPLPPERT